MQKKSTCQLVRRSLSTCRGRTRRQVDEGGSAPARRSFSKGGFLSRRALIGLLLCAATAWFILIPIRSGLASLRPQAPSNASQATLTFEERVSYQRAIEEVYWRHRIWPRDRGERPDPKPSLDAVMSQAQLEKKVTDYLRKSQALEAYWQRPITAEQLQAEMDRMVKHTKQPDVLRELFEALGNDPFVIAECLVRPALSDRQLMSWYAYDQRIHGELKQRAEAELSGSPSIEQMKQLSAVYSETELMRSDNSHEPTTREAQFIVELNEQDWNETVQELATFSTDGTDEALGRFTDIVSAYEKLVVGKFNSLQEDESRYYATAVIEKSEDHLKLATISWLKEPLESWLTKLESQVPSPTPAPVASYVVPTLAGVDGGCVDDSWTVTSLTNVPPARTLHTAVWTGIEMIVWGGTPGFLNSGGRYNPSTDTWAATSTDNAPSGRQRHTAVWTGSEMIIWGGLELNGAANTGGRYNPISNSWAATSTVNAPLARLFHTAIFSGSEMIVWGGQDDNANVLNTGGRYNPNTDSWAPTGTSGAPTAREAHKAVWTDSEMIVWGGDDIVNFFDTGGKYNPGTDSWVATSTTNVPDARVSHTAVWNGAEMIIWGGYNGGYLNTGGRYDPATNTWMATSLTNAPDSRRFHAAVWTGTEMIVWGGYFNDGNDHFLNTGARYDPVSDSWAPTSLTNVPTGRMRHTAVWSGDEMVVWGGQTDVNNQSATNTGGRYCAQGGPTPSPSPTPTPTATPRVTPRPRPTPHPRPTPP
jgi:N-acetylneuraminic acid mutarotase